MYLNPFMNLKNKNLKTLVARNTNYGVALWVKVKLLKISFRAKKFPYAYQVFIEEPFYQFISHLINFLH